MATINQIGVDSYGEGMNYYTTFLFKNEALHGKAFKISWTGKSTMACYRSPILLQVLNRVSNLWETLILDNTSEENVAVSLKANVFLNVSNYKDANGVVAVRVYQKIK